MHFNKQQMPSDDQVIHSLYTYGDGHMQLLLPRHTLSVDLHLCTNKHAFA